MFSNVLIVGGGLAAQRAAETLRARDHRGPIRIVCGEPCAPYDRPPLSKELTAAEFRPPAWYAEKEVELLLDRRAVGLDIAGRQVVTDAGPLSYDSLIVATGAHPRRLPGLSGRPNVFELRTVADAVALRGVLVPGARLAIVGAGFVGQEVAATARGLGVEATLIEAAEVPLAHVLGERLGTWFAALHRAEGVRVELGVTATASSPAGSPVTSLALSDGRSVDVDAVLVAIGVVPETRWLTGTPLADGVVVDEGSRTVLPHVYAAGDVVRGCEHWEPAARLGAAAARSILGLAASPPPPESFWSDQYGLRIHLVGSAAGADSVEIDGTERCFAASLRSRGALIGALLVDRPRELPAWRRRLASTQPERSAA